MASLLRRITIDVSPLQKSRDFRWLWCGLLLSGAGYYFTVVATFIQVYEITGSSAAVGLVGLVGLAGIVLGILAGGAFIDAIDRRTTLMGAQVAAGAGSGLLLLGAIADDPPVGVVYAGVALLSAVSAIDSSVRNATVPRLVGRELLPSALTLNQVVMNATALLGPAAAGIVIEKFEVAAAYGFDLVSSVSMLLVVSTIRPVPPEPGSRQTGWHAVLSGFRYLRGRRVLQAAFGADLVAMIFGMPRALFPLIAVTQFGRGAAAVGLLFAAPAVGALLGALTGGWVRRVRHQGRAVLWAVVAWGASIAAFGLVGDRLWLGLSLLAVAGAADVISAIFRGTIIQLSVPDELRGRLSSINYLVVAGGPRLGDLEAGLVASLFSPTVSIVSGGLLCMAGAGLIAWLVPSFRRYQALGGDEPAAQAPEGRPTPPDDDHRRVAEREGH
jgi:MFS family permease